MDQMWLYREYLPDWDWIRKTDVVIDIGAYVGTFSVLAAWLAPRGRVFAFEPNPENFGFLSKNVQANGLDNLVPYHLAVAGSRKDRLLIGGGTLGSLYEG